MANDNYVPVVDMGQFKNLIQFSSETKLPFCVWGEKAVGKTTGVYDWAKEHGYRCVVLHLATQDVVDLIGMMQTVAVGVDKELMYKLFIKSMTEDLTDDEVNTVKDYFSGNGENYKTIWSRPEWMVPEDDETPTLYFLDEFNRGNQFVLAAMLPFLIEGKMHTHKIGKNDFVIAACNPSNGNYNVNDSFEADDALKDRCGHAILQPTNKEFIDYAKTRLSKISMRMLNKNTSYMEVKTFKMQFGVEPSRRSLINVLSQVDSRKSDWIDKNAVLVLKTYLGSDVCDSWMQEYTKRLTQLDVQTLMDFDDNKKEIEDSITVIIGGREEVSNDIFENAVDNIITWVQNSYVDGISDISWLIKFLSIPVVQKDSIVSFLTSFESITKPSLYSELFESGLLDKLPIIEEYRENQKAMEVL